MKGNVIPVMFGVIGRNVGPFNDSFRVNSLLLNENIVVISHCGDGGCT